MIETVLTIILFLFILTVIICIHEFGHFIMAKKFGVQVDEFSIGMGPLVYKKIWHGTQYSIRALPIGGYVRMLGEGHEENKPNSFSTQAKWKRLVIIYAGVFMNFVLAAAIFTVLAIRSNGIFIGGRLSPDYTYPVADSHVSKIAVETVEDDSPAQLAGLKTFDVINKVNNIDYNGIDEYRSIINNNLEKPIPLEVISYLGGAPRTVTVTPRDKTIHHLSDKQGAIGFSILGGSAFFIRTQFTGIAVPFAGVLQTVNATDNYVHTLGTIFGTAIQHKDASIVSDSLTSPVGTYAITKRVMDLNGVWGVLTISALLTLGIGFMNAIPFPSLDGWHGLFIIIEAITKRKVKERLYNAITLAGFMLLLALGILIAIKDVLNFSKFFN